MLHRNLALLLHDNDVLLISGGVSKGKYDFVPQVLAELGVAVAFHRVKQKPGKPFWFGTGSGTAVFAFPGNPVSTFMCLHRYFFPWLWRSLGAPATMSLSAVLAEDIEIKSGFTYFLQVRVAVVEARLVATPVVGRGSGDHANLTHCNGFLELPPGQGIFKKNSIFPLILFRPIQ